MTPARLKELRVVADRVRALPQPLTDAENALHELLAEVERLRAALESEQEHRNAMAKADAVNRAEVERLRAALEGMVRAQRYMATDDEREDALETARAALEGKP
jgi:hypothetical protein